MSTDPPGSDETSDAALNDAAIAVALSGRPYEIADLWELPGNPHDGDDRAVADSLARFGQVKPIAVSADGCVIAGNTTFRAARDILGWSRIAGVEMTQAEAEQKAYALADNRTAQLGRDDPERMVAFFGEVEDWSGIGWDEDARAEIAALIAEPVVTPTPEVEPGDEAPLEPPSDPITSRGDVWTLGSHRVLCGSSRNPDHVEALLDGATVNLAVTSPPYADRRDYDETSGFEPIRPDDYVEWFAPVAANVADHLADDGSWLVNIRAGADDGQRLLYVYDLVVAHVRQWGWMFVDDFCWVDTKNGVPGGWPNRFKDAWEPVFHFARRPQIKFRPLANGTPSSAVFDYSADTATTLTGSGLLGVKATAERDGIARPSNVLHIAAASSGGHSAAFPVGLPAWFVRAFTDEGDTVYDPFMGSGSTLLAAHQSDRIGYGMEISAGYCDLIARRFQRVTGIVPLLDGQPVDFEDIAA